MVVPVSVLLQRKGSICHTIEPDATISAVTQRLAEHAVGALVVSSDGSKVDGVVSERDVVRALARHGEAALRLRASEVMTSPVVSCAPTATTDEIMVTMTEKRFRHVPVVADGRLVGIISIGDVVKWRIDELASQAEHLQDYVAGTY